ncbi:MAG: hypothetical protein SVP26_09750 [Chloroflexota bacterium]|nr:hypothetical protein [Chloroflexota bacterium]
MKRRVVTASIVVLLIAVVVGGVTWLMLSPCAPGKFVVVGEVGDGAEIPDAVRQDASSLALELCGGDAVQCQEVEEGLLEAFSYGVGKDFLLVFNSGGQGQGEIGPEWGSILEGIEGELHRLGYSTMLVVYSRTPSGFWSFIKEIRETFTAYSSKVGPLAAQVDFLAGHMGNARVLLLGESAGAILSNEALGMLEANPDVYSIQTGMPCIYRGALDEERSLVLNDNGVYPDSLSRGDVWAIFQANLGRIPTYRPEEGHFLFYMRTPGHIYTWEHPGVHEGITSFLQDHFGSEQGN